MLKTLKTICHNREDECRARLFIKHFTGKVFDYAINTELDGLCPHSYNSAVELCIIANANTDLCLFAFKRGVKILRELSLDKRSYDDMNDEERVKFNSDLKKRLLDRDHNVKHEFRANLENELFNLFYQIEKE